MFLNYLAGVKVLTLSHSTSVVWKFQYVQILSIYSIELQIGLPVSFFSKQTQEMYKTWVTVSQMKFSWNSPPHKQHLMLGLSKLELNWSIDWISAEKRVEANYIDDILCLFTPLSSCCSAVLSVGALSIQQHDKGTFTLLKGIINK